jgi:flagellar biosynthesis regulator FlaF
MRGARERHEAGHGMTVTSMRPRASEPIRPLALDIDCFRQVTAALTRCVLETAAANDQGGTAERQQRLTGAVHSNMALWGAVMHEMLGGSSDLPQPLRAHLVELAEVSIRHCSHVLRGEAAIDPLIAVNSSIIAGLQPSGSKQAAPAER